MFMFMVGMMFMFMVGIMFMFMVSVMTNVIIIMINDRQCNARGGGKKGFAESV